MKDDRRRLRVAILAQLSQRQMTLLELTSEVDHIAPANQVRRELLQLVGQDLVCSIENGKNSRDLFETWDRAMQRVRASSPVRRHIHVTRNRRGERMA